MRVKTRYSTIYNMRPGEMYGMGKESLTISGESSLEEFFRCLQNNSQLKHENALEWIVGTEDFREVEEWKPYIGQPMFYVVDIHIETVDDQQVTL